MKKLLFSCATILCCSCNLDVITENEISGDQIINSVEKAHSILAMSYNSLDIKLEDYTLLTEDLQPSYHLNSDPNNRLYYYWDSRSLEEKTSQIWTDYYRAIAHLNILLHASLLDSKQAEEWNYLIGNAKLLKGFIYFELLQLYSDRFNPNGMGIIPNEQLVLGQYARLSQQESLELIEQLISEGMVAVRNHPNFNKSYYINQDAGNLIQAEVALFKQQYQQAEEYARDIIKKYPHLPNSEDVYKNLWVNTITEKSPLIFWAFDFNKNPNQYLRSSSLESEDLFYINSKFIFDQQDIRASISSFPYQMQTIFGESRIRPLLGKYRLTKSDIPKRMIVMHRPTEAYFILMESLVEQGKLEEAFMLINQFRETYQLPLIQGAKTQQELRNIIRAEKQKEFIGERINFFDLKRWNISISRNQIDADQSMNQISATDYRWTWPIPNAELRYNPHATQNPGWRAF